MNNQPLPKRYAPAQAKRIEEKTRSIPTAATLSGFVPKDWSWHLRSYTHKLMENLRDRNYPYGTTLSISRDDTRHPAYSVHAKSVSDWCVFTERGWEIQEGNNLNRW